MKCKNLGKIRVNSNLARSVASPSPDLFPYQPSHRKYSCPSFPPRVSLPDSVYGLTLPLTHTATPHNRPHYHHPRTFSPSVHSTAINPNPAFSLSLSCLTRPAASHLFLDHYCLSKYSHKHFLVNPESTVYYVVVKEINKRKICLTKCRVYKVSVFFLYS